MESDRAVTDLRQRVLLAIGMTLAVLILLYLMRSDCMIVEGARYRSPQEVDNIVGGTMHPELSFSKGTFTWLITDIVTRGAYDCRLGRIHVYSDYIGNVTARLDRWTGTLYWNGDPYVRNSR